MVEIMTRKEAKEKNLKRYFTGEPCKYGHISERVITTKNCIECEKIRLKIYREKPENKAKMSAASKRFYEKNREKVLAKSKARILTGYNKEYYYKNKEKFLEGVKRWIKANPQRRSVYAENRRAVGVLKFKEVKGIITKQKHKCAICFCKLPARGYHIDHIHPIAKGGTNEISNIQITCETCNRRKGSKNPFDYAKSLGRLL